MSLMFMLRHSALRIPRSAILLFLSLSPCPAQDEFALGVRTTPWLAPEDEQQAFQLPPGFEINLVAAEPDIQKPLNMAFDERGRIWLTCSVEYPYAAPLDKPGRDSIRVLEDTDGDGRYEKVHTFADGLNIPIGIYPYKGGCIAWSIPNIWHFEDTDQDGVCDKRTVLYGPFDHTRDTHGMVNSLRRGFDGWVYACHGFNNDSHVKGKDGHEVHLNSGNTFRFKLDGSRIEHFTHGQVNPFGMCFDELFNIFTADCHSKPLTQLIRGGYYPSFGKAHDGLGFVPSMMEHSHGSTAICGVVCYTGENFPKEYRSQFLSGNVMTSRINQNKPEYHGSTIKAIEQPDFLSTKDPWFRPVDLQVGPDGALYILDFYNRIIGHYEVPLPHPGRDRTSGRIWRVVYKGTGNGPVENAVPGVPGTAKAVTPGRIDLTKLAIDELIAQLDSPQLEHRLRVQHWIVDFFGARATEALQKTWTGELSDRQRVHVLWALEGLSPIELKSYLWDPGDESDLRVHIVRIAGTRDLLPIGKDDGPIELGVHHQNSFVKRAAAEACAMSPDPARVPIHILKKLFLWDRSTNRGDDLLNYALRMAIRNYLTAIPDLSPIYEHELLRGEGQQVIAPVFLSIGSPKAADFLIHYLENYDEERGREREFLQHAARHVAPDRAEALVAIIRKKVSDDAQLQATMLQAIHSGLAQRGQEANAALLPWGSELAQHLLRPSDVDSFGWTAVPVEGKPSESPWVLGSRQQGDGQHDHLLFYSLPKGEQRTGIYRSGTFAIPEQLSFWCCGHSGYPGKPLNDGNYVRLRDAATHVVLAESRPPRNDTARQFEWDLKEHAGKQGYIELVDGDTADAYAWLAVGRFSLPALNPSDTAKKQQLAAEIVGKLKLSALRPQLATLIAAQNTDGTARAAIGQALLSFEPSGRAAALVSALNEPAIPNDLRVAIGATLTRRVSEGVPEEHSKAYLDNLREVMKRAPARLQTTIADTLAGDAAGADVLLALVESGHASPRLLLAPSVSAKFATLKNTALDRRVALATARLPPLSETLDKLLAERRTAFAKATPNLERGQTVFTKHCAGCHQVAGQGSVVGPQLDGIGNRGLERLMEDILDPNRNVDVAFLTTSFRLTDGRVVSGLLRREEGAQLVLADKDGKEFTLAKDEIDQQAKTALSLMPANVPEIVPAEEFYDLLAWLLSQKQTKQQP